jgi:hypothetical protein
MKLVFLLLATGSLGHASITPLDLGAADGPLDPARLAALSGASPPPPDRNFAEIRDGVLRVTFKEGKKVTGTGLSLHVPIEPREICDLSFRIRYPEYFPAGLHGKQLGMSGGKGYDGGRGEEARFNGDGWSVRLQFDAQEDGIRNSLYVYQQGMEGKYGNGLGGGSFLLRRGAWHDLRLRVTMQSEPAAADGRIEVWCDGNKMIDRDGVQFVRKEAGRRIDRVRLEFFPGGGGDFPDTDHVVELADVAWGESDAAEDGRGWWRRTRELLGIWP